MKKLMLKALMVSGMIIFSAIPRSLIAQTNINAEPASRIQKEKSGINSDVADIKMSRVKIKSLEAQCKNDKDNDPALVSDKKELRKELANLNLYKANLKADKMALIDDHNLVISMRKSAIKYDKKELADQRSKLDNQLSKGEESSSAKTASAVAMYERELKNDQDNLSRERLNKNNDILTVNKEVKKSDGEFTGILFAENVVAKAKNQMEK